MQIHVGDQNFQIDVGKTLLNRWAEAILSLSQDGEAAAVPIDSEYVEIGKFVLMLAAIKQRDNVVVRSLWIYDDWFDWETADILVSPRNKALHYALSKGNFATTDIFGEYNLQALATGLLNAL